MGAGRVNRIAACGIGLDQVATAVIDEGNALKVILWRVDANGNVERRGDAIAPGPVTDVAVSVLNYELGGSFIATAARQADGNLRIDAWAVYADGTVVHRASDIAGQVNMPSAGTTTPRLSISTVGGESIAVHVRTASGRLKTILWRLEIHGHERVLVRMASDEREDAGVRAIAGCGLDRELAVAAVHNAKGNLDLIAYRLPGDARYLESRGTASAGTIGAVQICRIGTRAVATAVRDGGGHLKVILWRVSPTADRVTRLGSTVLSEAVDISALTAVDRDQFVTAFRDDAGNLRLKAWHVVGTLTSNGSTGGTRRGPG
jgi:hypothetical protein